jgi:two-component system response regulator HydG
MRVEELNHGNLLALDPEGGLIRFASQRALLLDAVALGLLRKYLVENLGNAGARTVLTQFGFAQGWRMAEALKSEFGWESDADWRRAGTRIAALGGLFRVASHNEDPLSEAGVMLVASYEAEQHLLHFGQADEPVCSTLCGLISGYLSHITGQEVFVLEDRCLARGDAACHLVGRSHEGWGEQRANELRHYAPAQLRESLDLSLTHITDTLKAAEARLKRHRRALVRVLPDVPEQPLGIIAKSPEMAQVVELTRRVAKVDSTVLITGESGCGKELVARLLHDQSTRALGPFVAVNCGAIPDALLESELFGHARGAFSGATHDRPGLFEAANGGTLLLDEVGEVSPAMQVKLLRVLQEREVRRVGENKTRPIDVRIVAATNRDLLSAVSSGAFRQDLYYRLKVVEVRVPPLRARRDDILPLARVLAASSARRMRRKVTGLSTALVDQILRYPWPGNVRELENAMERAVALAQSPCLDVADLPEEVRLAAGPTSASPDSAPRSLQQVEKDHILAVLEQYQGNRTRAAKQLEIGPATLYRKLKTYGLHAPSTEAADDQHR